MNQLFFLRFWRNPDAIYFLCQMSLTYAIGIWPTFSNKLQISPSLLVLVLNLLREY